MTDLGLDAGLTSLGRDASLIGFSLNLDIDLWSYVLKDRDVILSRLAPKCQNVAMISLAFFFD